jgi:predicted amidohydrolase
MPPRSTCRIGLCQMLVGFGEPRHNLETARSMIRNAAAQACDIAVLPECFDLGWSFPEAARMAEPIPGKYSDELCEAALQFGIWVVAGLTERIGSLLHNAAILISQDGDIQLRYRKINVLTDVEGIYTAGDRLSVVKTPWGMIGVDICADNFPDCAALGHSVARMGADMLLSPCSWAVDADHDNVRKPYGKLWRESYGSLAKLFDMAVVGVSNVGRITAGPWSGRKCIGCSLAVAPGGVIIAQGPYGECAESIIVADVPLAPRPAVGTLISPMLRTRGYQGLL